MFLTVYHFRMTESMWDSRMHLDHNVWSDCYVPYNKRSNNLVCIIYFVCNRYESLDICSVTVLYKCSPYTWCRGKTKWNRICVDLFHGTNRYVVLNFSFSIYSYGTLVICFMVFSFLLICCSLSLHTPKITDYFGWDLRDVAWLINLHFLYSPALYFPLFSFLRHLSVFTSFFIFTFHHCFRPILPSLSSLVWFDIRKHTRRDKPFPNVTLFLSTNIDSIRKWVHEARQGID